MLLKTFFFPKKLKQVFSSLWTWNAEVFYVRYRSYYIYNNFVRQ